MKNNEKNKKVLKIVGLVALFLLVFGLSYALFRITLTGKKKTKITTANFGITLTDINGNEEEEGIAVNLDKAVPEEDSEGLKREGYKFVVTNTGNVSASYELKIDSTGTLSDECIKYALKEKDYIKGNSTLNGMYSNEMKYDSETRSYNGSPLLSSISNDILDKTTLLPGEKIEYELKLWVAEDATVDEASNKTYEANVVVDGYQAKEYLTGKAGDNVDYTLYNDGTLVLEGTGATKAMDLETMNVYNNLGPIVDSTYQILKNGGMNVDAITGLNFQDEIVSAKIVGLAEMVQVVANGLSPFGENHLHYDDLASSYFKTEENFNQALDLLNNSSIRINRILVGEGITSLGAGTLVAPGDYMVSLPSTLTEYQLLGLLNYDGYTLVYPNSLTALPNDMIDTYNYRNLEYIKFPNITEIDRADLNAKHIILPNSLESVGENAIRVMQDTTIDIDNTREYVEANWDSNWLEANGHTVTINYLR